MSEFTPETKSIRYPADGIKSIHIACKNYRVQIISGEGDEIVTSYQNNRYRKMNVRETGESIYMEEEMAVTFYEFFRLSELMEDNLLEITVPERCRRLDVFVETAITGISLHGINAGTIRLRSNTGDIRVQGAGIGQSLTAQSATGKIFCVLPGSRSDYDIDCQTKLSDVCPPSYPADHTAGKKVVLHTTIHMPELSFLEDANQTEDKTTMAYCTKCGAELKCGETVCGQCGAEAKEDSGKEAWQEIADACKETAQTAAAGFAALLESGVSMTTDVVIPSLIQGAKEAEKFIKGEAKKE